MMWFQTFKPFYLPTEVISSIRSKRKYCKYFKIMRMAFFSKRVEISCFLSLYVVQESSVNHIGISVDSGGIFEK